MALVFAEVTKSMAIKAAEEEESDEEDKEEDGSWEELQEELNESMAMLVKKYRRFNRKPRMKPGGISRTFQKRNERQKDPKKKMVCFNCEKPSHFASECRQKKMVNKPKVKNEEYYKAKYLQAKAREEKSFITGKVDWAKTSSDEEEEIQSNMCLMVGFLYIN